MQMGIFDLCKYQADTTNGGHGLMGLIGVSYLVVGGGIGKSRVVGGYSRDRFRLQKITLVMVGGGGVWSIWMSPVA